MSPANQETIGVVGLGAIGGSLALALRDRAHVVGWSTDGADRSAAQRAGIRVCTRHSAWMDEIANTDIIVVAVPLDEVAGVIRPLIRRLPDETIVAHAASLQSRDALGLAESDWRRVIGTHPLAGSERSGFEAADGSMFRGVTVRAEARATETERQRIERVWRDAGVARISWGDATEHDRVMSWVSHLAQLTATALAALFDERGIRLSDTGAGARDATRLAASAFTMWRPILESAPDETVEALRSLAEALSVLAGAIEHGDVHSVATTWETARAWRTAAEASG